MKSCFNCGHNTSEHFCPSCGQKRIEKRLSIGDIIRDGLSFMFSLESPLWHTFVMLFKNPGRLSREFIAGKRKYYYKPFQYFIFTVLLYFVVRGLLDFDPVDNAMKMQGQKLENMPDNPSIRAGHFLSRNVNYFLPVWAVVMAAFDRLFFYKSPYNYAERVTHTFYTVSHSVFFGALLTPLTIISPFMDHLKYPVMVLWIIYSITSFHNRNYVWTIIKALVLAILSFAVYVAITFGSVVLLI